MLAARVRDVHAARVWVPLRYASWEAYRGVEIGVSRPQAYRFLDVARSLTTIEDAVAAGTEQLSRTRKHAPDAAPATVAVEALGWGLPSAPLIAISGRSRDVADLMPAVWPTSPTVASRAGRGYGARRGRSGRR